MRSNSRFARGSGCYTCNVCSRKTRATDPDAAGVGLCEHCYLIAGIENEISDNRSTEGPEWVAQREAEIASVKAIILTKGGRL